MKHANLKALFTAIANSIRNKTGGTDAIIADDFPEAIDGIATGGGDGDGTPSIWKDASIAENDVSSFSQLGHLVCPNVNDIALERAESITSIEFPNITNIPDRAFYYCNSIKKVIAPSATNIGAVAFSYCQKLETVYLPNMTHVGNSAFLGNGKLTNIDFSSVTTINYNAFSKTNLSKVVAPLATSIGERAFAECGNLTTVNLPLATSLGDYAFSYCDNLTTVDLPIVSIVGTYTFSNCTSLERITLQSADVIGNGAFHDCENIKVINLPKATSIGGFAFRGCASLQGVILGTHETVCVLDPDCLFVTLDENSNPTKLLTVFVPSAMFEYYRAAYEPAFEQYGFAGYFDYVFFKIEEHPEITG